MNRREKLERLHRIAQLKADRETAPLAKATSDLREAEKAVNDIVSHRSALSQDTSNPTDTARQAAQIERLYRLQSARLRDLATAHANLEIAKAAARPAIAKREILAKLRARSRND